MARRRKRGSIISKEVESGKKYRARIRIKYRDHYGPWRDLKKEAEQDLVAMQNAEEKAPIHTASMLQAWQAHLKRLGARNTKETTLHGYKLKWQAISKFFELTGNIAELDAGDVEAYVRWRRAQVKTRTVLHEMALLRAVCNTAIKHKWIKTNPVVEAEMPRIYDEAEPDWYTREELTALLITVRSDVDTIRDSDRDADVMEFLALTGLRLTEAASLDSEDLDVAKRHVVVREGKRGQRLCKANKRLLMLMRKFLDNHVPGEPIIGDANQIKWLFRYWSDRLGEPRLHPHAMRHSFATEVARVSGSPYVVMRALGHRSISMSLRYCHIAGIDVEHLDQVRFDVPTDESAET